MTKIDEIKEEHRIKEPLLKRLEEEAKFIIEPALKDKRIRVHTISSRVKNIESTLRKLTLQAESEIDYNLASLTDLVGIRVVCLLRSDIPLIAEIIRNQFLVDNEDNKIDGAEVSSFGYQSVHFIARLPKSCSGPRYDKIKTTRFEIQVRTIAMDAWAAASRYLDYKNDQGVPASLRKDFYALSGLFYVADTHFEMFFNEIERSRSKEKSDAKSDINFLERELNLDTLTAYLQNTLSKRERSASDGVSDLLNELLSTGYRLVRDLDRGYKMGLDAFLRYEQDHPPGGSNDDTQKTKRFNEVGVIRILLEIMDIKYRKVREESYKRLKITADWKKYDPYRKYVVVE